MKLLLVDDDKQLSNHLYSLLHGNYKITICYSAREALNKLRITVYDLIILDLNLPDYSGQKLCIKLRETGVKAPVLILSGIKDHRIKAELLDSGANDFVTKPFSILELKARIRSLLRQGELKFSNSTIKVSDLNIDTARRLVHRSGKLINLRRKEFDILECLAINADQVVAQEVIAGQVWDEVIPPSTLQVQINNLRNKVDKPFSSRLIETAHGIGYKLNSNKGNFNNRVDNEVFH